MIAGNASGRRDRSASTSDRLARQSQSRTPITNDAWYALNHTITKTMEYPMMCDILDQSTVRKVMRPFLNAGLCFRGRQSLCRVRVVWGPERYQDWVYGTSILPKVWNTFAILRHATRATLTGQLRTSMDEPT
jgi:hypothetical protein